MPRRPTRPSGASFHRAGAERGVRSASGDFATIALTDATARRGIGNRPAALGLNRGFRWPYGRRETSYLGIEQACFRRERVPRVIYRDRPEGSIGRREDTTTIDTRDDYSCLSFLPEASSREGLDALSCASVFTGDKGRFITPDDIGRGYAEPEETSRGFGRMRPLPATSPYPPRRDLEHAPQDHADVERYASDAARVMPELDAVSMATPPADAPLVLTWAVPASSPSGFTMLSIEINTEGGYGGPFDPTSFPTPTAPSGEWDSWSSGYGYPYRGQSSVIFDVVVDMPAEDEAGAPNRMSVTRPMRMGSLDASLVLRPIDGTIVDDPERSPGSGADRLRFMDDGARVRVEARVLCRP